MSLATPRPYVLTFGETMGLLKAETAGPLAHVSGMSLGMGGSESNVAIGLRRLGTHVHWVGRVGADSLGELITRELRAENVTANAVVDPDAPTGLMLKERRTSGSTQVLYYRSHSAGSRLCAADIPQELITGAALVHLTGITAALSPTALEAVRHVIDVARRAGIAVSFDLNYRNALWSAERAGEVYRELLPKVDLVFAGEDEATLAVGRGSDVELAERLCAVGPEQAIIKLGERGATALISGVTYRQDAVRVSPIDTVGAGDAFVAEYLSELLAGKGPQECLRIATTVGAFVCLVAGDWEGLPRRHELSLLTNSEAVSR